MRTKRKNWIFILFINIFISQFIFALYSPDEELSAFFHIENVTYSPVILNTESAYDEGPSKNAKVIKILDIYTTTTSSEYNRAIPHINIDNFSAILSNDMGSSNCRLLIKTDVDYDNNALDEVSWYEITDLKTYIYRREYLTQEARSFTLTFYYLIESPTNILNSNGSSNEFLTLDTGGNTNFYLFYLNPDPNETTFFFGNLTDSIHTQTVPESFVNNYDSYLNVNATRPASWDATNFFYNLGQNNLEWIIGLQASSNNVNNNSDYYVGLTISSDNDFKLISTEAGNGIKEFPYEIRLSKKNSNSSYNKTIEVGATDEVLIEDISDQETRYFYIYTYSNNNTYNLNAGRFSDNIYLNFVTDITNDYGNKSIKVFD